MFCRCKNEKPIVIYQGDDTDFIGNPRVYLELETDLDLDGVTAKFEFLGVEKTFDVIPETKLLAVEFTKEETKTFPVGNAFASLKLTDSEGRVRTVSSDIKIFVTDNVDIAYNITDDNIINLSVTKSCSGGEVDNTLTADSSNPVKSSGIWNAIWGALTMIPDGATSLYGWVTSRLSSKQDKLTAGENITIEGNVISANGGGGGSVEVDDELSRTSPNPVKSSGIWSAIWGSLTTTYTSVVDWAKSYFLPLSGGTMTGALTTTALTVGSRANGSTKGEYSVGEGYITTASGDYSHAEGDSTVASGRASHAEGDNATASGTSSHAEGAYTKASNTGAHAEGEDTTASGMFSHTEGGTSEASGMFSHAEGVYTIAQNQGEHAQGICNRSTKDITLHSVGIGTSEQRKNAEEITTAGKLFVLGVGGYDGTNPTADGVSDLAAGVNAKRSKDDLVVYDEEGEATKDTLAKKSEAWLVGGDEDHNTAKGFKIHGGFEDSSILKKEISYDAGGLSNVNLRVRNWEKDYEERITSYGAKCIQYWYTDLENGSTDSEVIEATIPDILNTANGASTVYAPRYPFATATVESGMLTLAPYSQNALTSDGTAFTVTMGSGTGKVRDCVFVVTAGDTAPTITWGTEFHPRTDAATDFACVAGSVNVYWITEYAEGQFAVAGWQVTAGGSEVAS